MLGGSRRGAVSVVASACLALGLIGVACSVTDDDSASGSTTTSTSVTVASGNSGSQGSGSSGPLPDCVPFEGSVEILVGSSGQVGPAFSVTQGELTFLALRLVDVADPAVLVKSGDGEWRALDVDSSSATGVPLGDGADADASRSSLGAQKVVECLNVD